MVPSYYEFFCPVKILSGDHAVDNIPYELTQWGTLRPMVITDRGVVEAGLLRIVEHAFADSELTIGAVYDRTPPDSSVEAVREIAGRYRDARCDCLMAVGGGSVIDTAKGVNILVSEEADDLLPFAGADMLTRPLRPLLVVPTTAGTGSEVTLVAVIADRRRNLKMLFTSHHLMPRAAVLDPRMTLSLPPRLTAATGMDALSHAMEAFICLQHNPLSDAFAFAAIRLISGNLGRAVTRGTDPAVRMALAQAAVMAGAAFSNSMVGMVHALGHAAGAVCRVPHGVAMNIFLPFGLEYNLEKVGARVGELLLPLGGAEEYAGTPSGTRPSRTIKLVRGLQQDLFDLCGLPRTLKDAGVPRTAFERIVETAVGDGALTFNPAEMDRNDALRILTRAYE